MLITKLDNEGRLYSVTNLLPDDQVRDILSLDWLNLPWARGSMQESWARRQIAWDHPDIGRVSKHINDMLPEINAQLKTNFTRAEGIWWVDEPGFTCGMHTDGQLPNSMQIYWIVPGPEYGTCFYEYNNWNSVKHHFISETNNGYIMLNHLNEDGSQPLQWHAMTRPVPEGTFRLSSYWYFYK